MSSTINQKLIDISSLTSKLLRRNFGRGPESCFAFANKNYLVFYIRGFLSPMESILLKSGNQDNIDISRDIVMRDILAQLRGVLELEFEQEVADCYHDWNYPNNTGMITIIFKKDILNSVESQALDFRQLIQEVDRISIQVEKKPAITEAFQITSKVYIVKRKGILVEIEKALIEKGYDQTLKVTKDELEKTFFHRSGKFEEIFQQTVADIFIDWNLKDDESILCFILR